MYYNKYENDTTRYNNIAYLKQKEYLFSLMVS